MAYTKFKKGRKRNNILINAAPVIFFIFVLCFNFVLAQDKVQYIAPDGIGIPEPESNESAFVPLKKTKIEILQDSSEIKSFVGVTKKSLNVEEWVNIDVIDELPDGDYAFSLGARHQ